jgi:predicted RNA binding protein YcfA (HicA-like mRNA interferase family)
MKADFWYSHHQTGSHIHFRHPVKTNTIIVPYHAGRELGTGLAKSLLKQAGLK